MCHAKKKSLQFMKMHFFFWWALNLLIFYQLRGKQYSTGRLQHSRSSTSLAGFKITLCHVKAILGHLSLLSV